MPDRKRQEEIAFNKRYSRFKVQIFYKHRAPITHYGNERLNCTVAQIRFGHMKQVLFNRSLGLQDCIDRITLCEKLYGVYQTAIIYDRKKTTTLPDGSVQSGGQVKKYIGGFEVECSEIFADEQEKKILTDVIHFQKDGVKLFDLKPSDPRLKT